MDKNRLIAGGYILASIGLFYSAINLWVCHGGTACDDESMAQAQNININVPTEYAGWSGRNDPSFFINAPGVSVTIPPPTQAPSGFGDDGDGDDGH